jgi:phosphohistidine phosphatase
MKTLILLRHAKSDWDAPSTPDFERPLSERGRKAAPLVGKWLRDEELVPDLVLASAAQRAQETLGLVTQALDGTLPVRSEHDLYMAEPDRILAIVRGVGDDVDRLMVVGHNPGIEQLARGLAVEGKKKALAKMTNKFPTGAAAVIEYDVASWADIAPGTGKLRAFVRPKDLKD